MSDVYSVTPAEHGIFLTPREHGLMDQLSEVVKGFRAVYDADIARNDSTVSAHNNDMGEVVNHIHDLQARVLSRAAARAYPGRYRLL